jgi:hypothetical protein
VAVIIAVLIIAATAAVGATLAACGSSDTSAKAAATAPPGGGQRPDMTSMVTQALDPLVEKGTITSDQETAVVAAISASLPSGGAPGQGGTPPGAGAQPSPGATPNGGAPPSGSRADPSALFTSTLDALVQKGTITATQEKAIVAALSAGMQGGPQGGGMQSQSGSSAQGY